MCNISDYYEEEILERGKKLNLTSLVLKKIKKGITSTVASEELETPLNVIQPIYVFAQTYPNADADQICEYLEASTD